ncbi:hypothetical protein INS49_009534 [Diaporthe citri]|uniref:uncharacterized protein n=1 Tax=Diaporthe citri TaxID=83186 RepID=UPI001C81FE3F|nr:uncharacterized protein INS49_009534 [Diaporthe citri]KAG6361309.1 hypothetical protein INS49_009534 [Diaporthe citri]
MQLSTLLISLMASLAIAVPTNTGGGGGGGGDGGGGGGGGGGGTYSACTSAVYSQAQCCSADVGNIADLTCASVAPAPSSAEDFRDICATTGQTAMCCTLSVIGVSLLCETPVGL